MAVLEQRDVNMGCMGCTEVTAKGNAVSQNAHSAVDRPMCQLLLVHAGQWLTDSE
jgi:hypothetical protein